MNKREVGHMNKLRDNISKMPSNKYFDRAGMLYLFDELMKMFGYTYSDGGYSKARMNNLEGKGVGHSPLIGEKRVLTISGKFLII